MPFQIPSYVQGKTLEEQNLYRVIRDLASFCNSLEATVRGLNNHVVTGGAAKQVLALTPAVLSQIEKALEAAGSNPLNVDSLPGILLDPQGAGIPTATSLPDINTVGPGAAYFVGGILYIADKTVIPATWDAITTSTAPQAAHKALIGPSSGGAATPTYRSLVLTDLPTTPTGTGNLVLDTSPTIANPKFNTGIQATGSGLKHLRTTTGSIAASTTTDVTITFATTLADANYTPVVSIIDSSNQLEILGVKSKAASNFVVTVRNNDAGGAHTGELSWVVMHD